MQNSPGLGKIFPLPDEARKLQVFVGDWIVSGSLTFNGVSFAVKGHAKMSSVAEK